MSISYGSLFWINKDFFFSKLCCTSLKGNELSQLHWPRPQFSYAKPKSGVGVRVVGGMEMQSADPPSLLPRDTACQHGNPRICYVSKSPGHLSVQLPDLSPVSQQPRCFLLSPPGGRPARPHRHPPLISKFVTITVHSALTNGLPL